MNDGEYRYLGELTAYAKLIAQCLGFLVFFVTFGTIVFALGDWPPSPVMLAIDAGLGAVIALLRVARVKHEVRYEQHPRRGIKLAPKQKANASYNPDGCDGSQEYE